MSIAMPPLDEIRAAFGAAPDGSLRLLHLDEQGGVLLEATIQEGAGDVDELLARYVATLICDVDPPGAAVVVTRRSGRPTGSDRQLWDTVRARLPGRNIDFVVAGADRCWSALSDDRRGATRRSASRAAGP
jgi:hypothetical protein